MVCLETSLGKMKLKNPIVLASGIRGNSADLLIRAAMEGAGAATSKSCSLLPREGHNNPTMLDSGGVMMNAVGLSNPGVDEEKGEIARAVKEAGIPIIASIFGKSPEEFAKVAQSISEARPHMIEADISCPNIHREGMMFSSTPEDAASVVAAVREATALPISVKLSPQAADIGAVARACAESGADCITAINTMGGMFIDARARRSILHNSIGGISGPALKPVSLRCVYSIRKAVGPKMPIIGTGGVTTGIDAIEMLMAGATAVGIGSAVVLRKNAFADIAKEMESFMAESGYKSLSKIALIE